MNYVYLFSKCVVKCDIYINSFNDNFKFFDCVLYTTARKFLKKISICLNENKYKQ